EKTAGKKIIGKGHNSAPGYSPDNHALQFVTVNGRAIRGMSVYDTTIDVCFWGIADIDGKVTCPLCASDRSSRSTFCRDWDRSHGQRQFCDIKKHACHNDCVLEADCDKRLLGASD